MTTLTPAWRDDRGRDPVFSGVQWNRQVEVETTTLDDLIARFGVPVFVKIDVEGGEPGVLAGLTHAIRSLSFEYLPHALDYTDACVTRLNALGCYRFNWSPGESYRLMSEDWAAGVRLFNAGTHQSPFADCTPRLRPRPAASSWELLMELLSPRLMRRRRPCTSGILT